MRLSLRIKYSSLLYCSSGLKEAPTENLGFINFGDELNYCIPSGNFGSMYSALTAKRLGIPFGKLRVATNENRVLADVFETGTYSTKDRSLVKTKSCAMDILTSSNFERLVSDLFGGKRTDELYRNLREQGIFHLTGDELARLKSIGLSAHEITEDIATKCQAEFRRSADYLLCPHSAVGVAAAQRYSGGAKELIAATAHPNKFEIDGEDAQKPAPSKWLQELPDISDGDQVLPGS